MNCPEDIRRALLGVMTEGVLSIRTAAMAGDANRCLMEADHVHNLPNLLADYSPELLNFYWHTERRVFIEQLGESNVRLFENHWKVIAKYVSP